MHARGTGRLAPGGKRQMGSLTNRVGRVVTVAITLALPGAAGAQVLRQLEPAIAD